MKRSSLIAVLLLFVVVLPVSATEATTETHPHPEPLAVVIQVLALEDAQIRIWSEILQARENALHGLADEVHAREVALGELLQSPLPDPTALGVIVLQIARLHQQTEQVAADARGRLEHVLNEEQRQRLHGIREAARVCPVVPAFNAVGL